MQLTVESVSLILMLITFVFSYQGFIKLSWVSRYVFQVEKVLVWKEYYRLVSSGFLHSGWMHLIFNMYALYVFGASIGFMPPWYFLLLYFSAMVGGNLLALQINRRNPGYSAYGASGAVNGIIFAAATLFPTAKILLFFIIPIPYWLFALAYLTYTIWGIRSKKDNIGHEAHLGGAVVGIIMAIGFYPQALESNWWIVLLMLVPIGFFFYIVIFRPEVLVVPSLLFKKSEEREPSHVSEAIIRPMRNKNGGQQFKSPEEEIDYLLDKGVDNLTAKEKRRLDELSGNI